MAPASLWPISMGRSVHLAISRLTPSVPAKRVETNSTRFGFAVRSLPVGAISQGRLKWKTGRQFDARSLDEVDGHFCRAVYA